MESLGRYETYRNFELPHVGKVPSHWSTSKFRYTFNLGKGLTITKADLTDEGVACVSYGEVHSKFGFEVNSDKHPLKCVRESYLKCAPASLLKPGDIVFADTSEDIEGAGNFSQSTGNSPLFAGYHTIIARNSTNDDARFLAYLLDSQEYRTQIQLAVKGVKVFSITQSILRGTSLWLPPLDEQIQIAKFLDYETARIDALIDKQQQLITLLKEKRQAFISHAVTKGLNPDAPLKDSSIEWLGQVPEHWNVMRLKHIAHIQSGMPKGKPESSTSISTPMLRVANVQDGWLNLQDVHKVPVEKKVVKRFLLQDGDVLMNEGGDRDKLGRGTIWHSEIEGCIHQNHVFAIRPTTIESEWLDVVTRADYAKYHFYQVAKQSTNLASISSTNIKETPLVVPPKNERRAILQHIESSLVKTNSIIESAESQSSLLQEHRSALISAAVTGKIDVRNWQPPATADSEETSEEETGKRLSQV